MNMHIIYQMSNKNMQKCHLYFFTIFVRNSPDAVVVVVIAVLILRFMFVPIKKAIE